MRREFVSRCVVLFLFTIVLFLLPLASQAKEVTKGQAEMSLENASPEEIALHVAKLND